VAGIKEFLNLIYNGKFRGPSPRCGGPAARSGPWWTMGGGHWAQCAGARARQSSPAVAKEDEGDEAVLEGC
jgi:hypothetical protein